jgi:hypothetical protein
LHFKNYRNVLLFFIFFSNTQVIFVIISLRRKEKYIGEEEKNSPPPMHTVSKTHNDTTNTPRTRLSASKQRRGPEKTTEKNRGSNIHCEQPYKELLEIFGSRRAPQIASPS